MRSTESNPPYLGVGGRGIYKSALIEWNKKLSEVSRSEIWENSVALKGVSDSERIFRLTNVRSPNSERVRHEWSKKRPREFLICRKFRTAVVFVLILIFNNYCDYSQKFGRAKRTF